MLRSKRFGRWIRQLAALLLVASMSTACIDEVLAFLLDDEYTVLEEQVELETSGSNVIPIERPARPDVDPDDQTWLVMFYSDADDEVLEEDMFFDLNEAELVGSSDRVTIVAQMDRYKGGFDGDGDWHTAKRFLIESDFDLDHLNSTELMDLGEVNMADADTLIDFVVWASNTYPADNYALIMSNHGAGWPGGWTDPKPGGRGRHDIALAEGFGDMLFLMEMADAFDYITKNSNIKNFELIGFDACFMSAVEVYAAIAPYARYAVASEEVEPSLGWAYASFLAYLVDNPEISGKELAEAIVESYIDQDQLILDDDARAKYVERAYEIDGEMPSADEIVEEELKTVTLTAIDLDRMPYLLNALDDFVYSLGDVDEQERIAAARRYTHSFMNVFGDEYPEPYIDLGNFAKIIQREVDNADVNEQVGKLQQEINRAVISMKNGEEHSAATGISIYFPNSSLYTDDYGGYKSYSTAAVDFTSQSLWDDFLAYHYSKRPLPQRPGQNQPKPDQAPVVVNESDISAPGSSTLTIDPIEQSSSTASINSPVTLTTQVRGENIGFLYVFIGYQDVDGTFQMIDVDYLDSEEVREVGGMYYPDWGGDTVDIEFDWDASIYAVEDDEYLYPALLFPQDFGSDSASASYTLSGIYESAKDGVRRRANLIFSDGEMVRAVAYTSESPVGAMSELRPKRGDTFTILTDWIDSASEISQTVSKYKLEGETLTFGENNLLWSPIDAPAGNYLVGFIAEDIDGNWYTSYTQIEVIEE